MIYGIQFWMFKVRYAVKGSNATVVQACAQSGPGNVQFVVLENNESAIEKLNGNQLKALYSFFTGEELKPFPRYLSAAWPMIKKVFDEDRFEKAAGFKVPVFKPEDEPLEVRTTKLQKFADSLPETNEGVEAYNPETDKNRSSNPVGAEIENENEEDTEMSATKKTAKKSAKKAVAKKSAKKAAPKAAKKSTGEGAGRKAPYEPTAKLTALVKENPCNPLFAGKPGVRHANMEIILKNPGITFEKFLAKGGTLHDLQGLAVRKNYVKVSK